MYKSEEIARRIQQVLRSPETVGPEDDPQQVFVILNELADDYSDACKRVNEQLRHAKEYASVGNTGEAIRFIELFHVREDYENLTLDSQQERWKLFCQEFGLAVPVPLEEDLYNETKYLYESYEPIKTTLSKFRLLSLERGPLKERLALLRKLATLDMGNTIWDEMAAKLEKARDEEIEAEFRALPKTKESFSAANELLKELSPMAGRVTEAPESTVKKIRGFIDGARHEKQVDVLQNTVSKMLDAYREGDRPEVERFMADWVRFTCQMQQNKIPQRLIEDVKGPSEWLKQLHTQDALEQDFNEKLFLLRQSFSDGSDMEEIIDAHGAAERAAENCGKTIPESDEKTFKLRVRAHHSQRNKKAFYKFSLIALICLLVAGGTGWGIYSSYIEKTYRDKAQRLSALMDSYEGIQAETSDSESEGEAGVSAGLHNPDKLKEADKLAEQYKAEGPRTANAPILQEKFSRLEQLKESETKRSEGFEQARADAEKALESGDELSSNLLEQLDQFGNTVQDRGTVLKLKKQNDELAHTNQEARESEYSGILEETEKKFSDLETAPLEEKEELIAQIKENLSKLRSIAAHGTVADPLKKVGDEYTQKCEKIEREYEAAAKLAAEFATITEAIGDDPKSVDAFLEEMEKFASQYPNNPIATGIEKIKNCCAGYRDVILWNNFVAKVGTTPMAWEKNSDFLSEFGKIKSQTSFISDLSVVSGFVDTIRTIHTFGGRARLAQQLISGLEPYNDKSWVWPRQDPNGPILYYYLTQKPDLSYSGDFILLTTRGEHGKTSPISTTFTQGEIDTIVPAPHREIAQTFLERLKDSEKNIESPTGWCETVIDLLTWLDPNDDNQAFDPVVKVSLIQMVVGTVKKDPIFADKLSEWERIIKKNKEFNPDCDWINPENSDLTVQRTAAGEILKQLGVLPQKSFLVSFRDRADKETNTKISMYPWVGWLNNERGTWKVMFKKDVTVSGELFMAAPKSSGSAPELVKVGTAEGNKVTLSSDAQKFVVGAPVLVRDSDDSGESPQ